ncbi:MAG: TlpA disulfide reductase family protein [Pseudomonadota bacterium]
MLRSIFAFALMGMVLTGCDSPAQQSAQRSNTDTNGAGEAGEAAAAPPPLPGKIVRVNAGTAVPDLTFADPDGKTLELAKVGEPVLLNLWATWCAPCVLEMPMLDRLADELAGEVRVITISQDIQGAEKVVPFFAEKGFQNLEPWLDPETELGANFADGGVLPQTILFDAQGREVFRVVGDYKWDSEEAIAAIREALAE